MKILIYDNCLDGHHLEYIHHLYSRAISENSKTFVFVLPDYFLSIKHLMNWPDSSNISYDFITEIETHRCNSNKFFHFLGTQIYSARLLRNKIRKHNPDHVFMMSIDMGIPYLELFLPFGNKTKISCICYRMIPYQWESMPLIKKIIEWITYNVVLKKKRYSTIFLLNNHKFVSLYNQKYKTEKYKYLTDPVTVDKSIGVDLRDSLNIPRDANVFIHLGVMGKHKGTINILEAVGLLNDEEAKNIFVFIAGKIGEMMKEEFYQKLSSLLPSRNIIVYDKFCEYELFASLYKTCDYVLFPYVPRPNSSGLLGNAALYGKPVITTDGGAMGDLVREYHLGYLMPDNSPSSIRRAMVDPEIENFSPEQYVKEHTIDQFCDQIFSAID